MKARLVLTARKRLRGRPRSLTNHWVVFLGKRVGRIHRRRDLKHGKWPWAASARLMDGRIVKMEGFMRRGDAKRWVLKTQDIVMR